jgi:hypothetical protein
MAQQVVPADFEVLQQVTQLVAEKLDRPKVRPLVGQMGGLPGADLVVKDYRDAVAFGESGEYEQVIVRGPRTAMEDDEGDGTVRGEVAEYLDECLILAEGDQLGNAFDGHVGALLRLDRSGGVRSRKQVAVEKALDMAVQDARVSERTSLVRSAAESSK